MDRRSFLGMSGAGLLGGWLKSPDPEGRHPADRENVRYVEESGRYRLIREIEAVDWIVVDLTDTPTRLCNLDFIYLPTFPDFSVPVSIPLGGSSADFSVLGDIPYTTSLSCWASDSKTWTNVWFADTASVRLYEWTGRVSGFKDIVVISRKRPA